MYGSDAHRSTYNTIPTPQTSHYCMYVGKLSQKKINTHAHHRSDVWFALEDLGRRVGKAADNILVDPRVANKAKVDQLQCLHG